MAHRRNEYEADEAVLRVERPRVRPDLVNPARAAALSGQAEPDSDGVGDDDAAPAPAVPATLSVKLVGGVAHVHLSPAT